MSSIFGKAFRVSTFGESHGPAIGAVIDGCPAGVKVDEDLLAREMARRKPGQSSLTTQRKEEDQVEILSGVFEGYTTGTPIGLLIRNADARSKDYTHLADAFRPGHADLTWYLKYQGRRDHRGGGRSSARETAARVAAGAIARMLLQQALPGYSVLAWVQQVGQISIPADQWDYTIDQVEHSPTRCPLPQPAAEMEALIKEVKKAGDTIGGVVACQITGVPPGLGEPVYDKLHAELGKNILNINACKGVEFGSGFAGVHLLGSQHNDLIGYSNGHFTHETNRHGGTLGGISSGMPIQFRAAFKPVATILRPQPSVNADGEAVTVEGRGRHDPCVLPRAVPIVEAMASLTIADMFLRQRMANIFPA